MYHGVIHVSNRAAARGEKEVKDKYLFIDDDRAKVVDHLFVKCMKFHHVRCIEFEIIRDILSPFKTWRKKTTAKFFYTDTCARFQWKNGA